ncbi:amidase signature domain-containing protein [Scenedesmus sp. NREL 46B-D3]|nr:amidase signature domain-containing protein [Scenedesmus sp. NREL 46B-D3]
MGEPIVAHITLRSANSIKQQDEVESLAAALTAALKLKQGHAGTALKLAVQFGEAQFKATSTTEEAFTCSKLPFTQALKDSFSQGRSATEAEVVVASKNAEERVAAALVAMGHNGYTLVSTPPNVRPTVRDYHYSYMKGMITPTDVAERLVSFLEKHNSQFNWLSVYSADHIRHQAAASAARYTAGSSLSVFDGVPYVVKDCLDALPYETACGTAFLGKLRLAKADAPCVATLRSMGAILLGKASMPELNSPASTSSMVNPHDPSRTAGSGSAGCASAVACGLCPIAVGADVGGSMGVPSSFCGVVGFRASSGRLADDAAAAGSHSSLTATTPIANSIGDAMLLYAAMANTAYPRAATPRQLSLPKELLAKQERSAANADWILGSERPLQEMKIGLCRQWLDESSGAVQAVLGSTLERLQQLGAMIVDVTLPDLEQIQATHLVTFSKEAAADGAKQGWLNKKELRSQLALDTRMFLCNASKVTDAEYGQAQRVRAKILAGFEKTLKGCDVIMTPATATVAPSVQSAAAGEVPQRVEAHTLPQLAWSELLRNAC